MNVNFTFDPQPQAKHRLRDDALKIFEDYWHQNIGQTPSHVMRRILTNQVKQIPGHEYYTSALTKSWFERRVKKWRQSGAPSSTLTARAIEQLTVLLRDQPEPSQVAVETWASMLASHGVAYQDVINWVNTNKLNVNKPPTNTRLPTPADTASPSHSPSLPPSSPVINHMETQTNNYPSTTSVKRELLQSPTLAPLIIPNATVTQHTNAYVPSHQVAGRYPPSSSASLASNSSILSSRPPPTPVSPVGAAVQSASAFPARIKNLSHPNANTAEQSSVKVVDPRLLRQQQQQQQHQHQQHQQQQQQQQQSLPTHSPAQPQPCTKPTIPPLFHAILQGVADATSTPTTQDTARPLSSTEFNQMFELYEEQMNQLMQSLENS